jgi:hypothetical protein
VASPSRYLQDNLLRPKWVVLDPALPMLTEPEASNTECIFRDQIGCWCEFVDKSSHYNFINKLKITFKSLSLRVICGPVIVVQQESLLGECS